MCILGIVFKNKSLHSIRLMCFYKKEYNRKIIPYYLKNVIEFYTNLFYVT